MVEERRLADRTRDGENEAVCGTMGQDDQSCLRHSKASWDRIKTTQALIHCLETDLQKLQKHTRRTEYAFKKYNPFLLSVSLFL